MASTRSCMRNTIGQSNPIHVLLMSYGDLRGKNSAVDTEHLFEQAPRGCLPFWTCKVVFSQYCPPTALGWLLGGAYPGVWPRLLHQWWPTQWFLLIESLQFGLLLRLPILLPIIFTCFAHPDPGDSLAGSTWVPTQDSLPLCYKLTYCDKLHLSTCI